LSRGDPIWTRCGARGSIWGVQNSAHRRYPGGTDALSNAVATDLRDAKFAAQASANIVRWKYGKLLRNLGNTIDALAIPGADADAFRRRAVAEAEAVLKVAGIVAEAFDEESLRLAGLEVRPVPGLDAAGSSTWQSLAKGRKTTEADYLNGEIVLLGRLHNVPTPINHALQQAANEFARRGQNRGAWRSRKSTSASLTRPIESLRKH
jgi:2-dehydropantoate 2-reductase